MPELPDVDVFRQQMAAHGLGREIAAVDLRDSERLRGARTDDLVAALQGYAFDSASRHGKVLFLKVSCGWTLAMHFGMIGRVVFHATAEAAPDHARLVLRFADGGYMSFDDTRRLGWVELTDDAGIYLRSQDIGPDALTLDRTAFGQRLHAKHSTLKSALMDQATLAGIGNVYSDEILFQAGLLPDRDPAGLEGGELDGLLEVLHAVLTEAIARDAEPEHFPSDWLTPHRQADAACPRCGTEVATRKIGGRTAYYCPRCQH
jgi:formamidopyrimidine-DNA glycosylase